MIYGTGLDVVELERIKNIIAEKPKLITRILTENEYQLFSQRSVKRQIEFLGGRYACKEAFSKAWGTGIGKVSFQEIEILSNSAGAPEVTASPFKKGRVFVSITHTDELALAQIVLET
ncbi:holo-ACP synthase [Tetragenococcus osmophilus]|uniref:Holo-[acyl-carrier-protein] synthase n=1 Tax=Tetragenococcus osmophilus TaxID=526944 RepID=A0AA37XMK4_9ENTE|nr:holo-ACP synthase [Tetragenococcus osmophilus]AYW47540.1 holo-ACP synthase [Tetragenococcus osmophilus]GMA53156.1 holo-[acyl-carrier-protein] synthase [Alicyclobacillus contaminans]GMA72869.1 holo-[acyl-carrier-protein] synthase [Tetragenococcus osmophilus]